MITAIVAAFVWAGVAGRRGLVSSSVGVLLGAGLGVIGLGFLSPEVVTGVLQVLELGPPVVSHLAGNHESPTRLAFGVAMLLPFESWHRG